MTECHVDNFGGVLITFLGILTNCHVFCLDIWIILRIFRVVVGGRTQMGVEVLKKRVKKSEKMLVYMEKISYISTVIIDRYDV